MLFGTSVGSTSTMSPPGWVFAVSMGWPSTLLGFVSASIDVLAFFFGFSGFAALAFPAGSSFCASSPSRNSAARLRVLVDRETAVVSLSTSAAVSLTCVMTTFVATRVLALFGADFGAATAWERISTILIKRDRFGFRIVLLPLRLLSLLSVAILFTRS